MPQAGAARPGVASARTEPSGFPMRERAMGDKSPKQSTTKKPAGEVDQGEAAREEGQVRPPPSQMETAFHAKRHTRPVRRIMVARSRRSAREKRASVVAGALVVASGEAAPLFELAESCVRWCSAGVAGWVEAGAVGLGEPRRRRLVAGPLLLRDGVAISRSRSIVWLARSCSPCRRACNPGRVPCSPPFPAASDPQCRHELGANIGLSWTLPPVKKTTQDSAGIVGERVHLGGQSAALLIAWSGGSPISGSAGELVHPRGPAC